MTKKLDQTKPLVQAPEYRTTLNNWTLLLIDKRIDPSKKKKNKRIDNNNKNFFLDKSNIILAMYHFLQKIYKLDSFLRYEDKFTKN